MYAIRSYYGLDTDAAGSAGSGNPRIRIQGTDVYVVWEDERNEAVKALISMAIQACKRRNT